MFYDMLQYSAQSTKYEVKMMLIGPWLFQARLTGSMSVQPVIFSSPDSFHFALVTINYVDTDWEGELRYAQLHELHIVVSFDTRIKRMNSEQHLNLC
jgi:hypothetical protein